jgi:hypothetical protein
MARPREVEVGYAAVHRRLRVDRGWAYSHPCAECGDTAQEWAYDHLDPEELVTLWGGREVAHSLDQAHYRPLCHRCHRRADRNNPPLCPKGHCAWRTNSKNHRYCGPCNAQRSREWRERRRNG